MSKNRKAVNKNDRIQSLCPTLLPVKQGMDLDRVPISFSYGRSAEKIWDVFQTEVPNQKAFFLIFFILRE